MKIYLKQNLILKTIIVLSLLFSVPSESFAGSKNIYGVQSKSGYRGIAAVRSRSFNSSKIYGSSGASIKNNYFGGSRGTSVSNKSKTKNMGSSATSWDGIYSGQRRVNKPVRRDTALEGMEAF